MTDWKARIAALPPYPDPHVLPDQRDERMALAVERLKEPHADNCAGGVWIIQGGSERRERCSCGHDDDVLAILSIDP